MRSQTHIWAHTLKPRCFWLYRSIFLKCVANYLYSSLSPCCAEHDSFPSSTHCLSGKWVECVWNSYFFKKEKINQCSHFGGNFNEIQQWDLPITTSCRQGTDVAAFLQTQKIEVSARAVRVPHRQLCDEGRVRENIPSDDCYRTDLISCLSKDLQYNTSDIACPNYLQWQITEVLHTLPHTFHSTPAWWALSISKWLKALTASYTQF